VKRFAAFEPPEYLAWKRDEAVMREYAATLARDPERKRMVNRPHEP
jgi:hypothetical protein